MERAISQIEKLHWQKEREVMERGYKSAPAAVAEVPLPSAAMSTSSISVSAVLELLPSADLEGPPPSSSMSEVISVFNRDRWWIIIVAKIVSCYVIIILCTTSLVLPTSTLTFLAKSQEKSFWALRPPTPRQHGVLDLANVRPSVFTVCFFYVGCDAGGDDVSRKGERGRSGTGVCWKMRFLRRYACFLSLGQKVDTVPVVSFALHRATKAQPFTYPPSYGSSARHTQYEISVRVITPCTNINLSKLRSSSQP